MKNVLIPFFFLVQFSFAQTASIKGKALTSDHQPAHMVSITLKNSHKGTSTDDKGEFEIKNVAAGSHLLIASFLGLETKEISVEVRANETVIISDIILKETAKELSEIDVFAQRNKYAARQVSSSLRLATPINELPQNIQVVTPEMLKDQQAISMSDGLIRNVSGAVRVEHWGDLFTKIYSRGSQVQAFRNGFNVVNSSWGPLTEDMSFVERIEFVKGPAGFMLSNGDPSGLYNIVTKKPSGISKREMSFMLGSFNLYRTAIDVDGKLSKNKKFLYRLNLSAQNKKSFRANEHNDRYVIAPALSYQLSERTKVALEYNYQRANMSDVGSFYVFSTQGLAALPRRFTTMPEGMPTTKINDHSFYATLTHSFHKNWHATAQVSRFAYRQQGTSMWPTKVNDDGTMIRQVGSWDAKSDMTMGQIFVNGEFSTGAIHHRVLNGIDVAKKNYFADWGQKHELDTEAQKFDVNRPANGAPIKGYPNFDSATPLEERAKKINGLQDQRYNGIYLQDELSAFENKARLTLAGRFTYVKQSQYAGNPKTANRFTPRIGLSYSINKNTTAYALYDQSFIPQSGRLSDGGEVKPLTGENREIGIKRDWFGGQWNTTLSYYNTVKKHELIGDPTAPPNSGLSIELGEKTAEGIEFDLKGAIVRGLTLVANYAYTDSRITKLAQSITTMKEGDILPGYATHAGNAWVNYKLSHGRLKGAGASLGVTYLAKRQTFWNKPPDPTKALPNYFKLDGGLFWEKNNLKIAANVFNILDAYLYNGSYYSWLKAYYWQADPPRTIRLSVSYSF